jgi:signal transduction histidine kinase
VVSANSFADEEHPVAGVVVSSSVTGWRYPEGQYIGIPAKTGIFAASITDRLAQEGVKNFTLAEISRGTFTLHKQAVNVNALLINTLASFKPLAEQQFKHLSLEIEGDLPKIDADPARLKKVLVNLLSNAI